MEKIIVELGKRSYPIFVGSALFDDSFFCWPLCRGDRVLLVTDDRVASLYLGKLCDVLIGLDILVGQLILPIDGERNKSLVGLDLIFTKLLTENYDRSTVLIALGGGVVGDLTGFVASVYQRGIKFIQVPTTLLAQVDAAIGGKTGINHTLGKNMIGSFYQPVLVISNLDFLCTLALKELSCGLSEIIKYAVSFDAVFFSWLENNMDGLLNLNLQSLMYCVCRCCKIKASVISMDECEKWDVRDLLNFGHTFGHAIESYFNYSDWSHGEAIAAGMMMAVCTSIRMGNFDFFQAARVRSLLIRAGLPICGPQEMLPADYLMYMRRDKKSKLGKINLVLPVAIGSVKKFFDVQEEIISSSIEENYN